MANRNRIDDVNEHGGLNTDCFADCQIFSGVAAMFLSPLYSYFLNLFSNVANAYWRSYYAFCTELMFG